MRSNKLLFLDFDGVLHSTTTSIENLFHRAPLLNELLRELPCPIVISSSWRFNLDLSQIKSKFEEPLSSLIIGKTGPPEIGRWPRYSEIKKYLQLNKPLVDWRALDDSFLEFPADCKELILCNPKSGITEKEILQIRHWLEH